jgi:MFS family permease
VVTIHLLQVTTLTPLLVAALFAPAALARLLSSLLSGRVFTALGPRGLLLGLTAQSTLLLVMALFAPHLGVLPLAFATATVQVGLGLCSGVIEPSMRVVTLSYATGRTHGVAASFLQLTQRLSATALVALTTGILLGVSGTATGARLGAALGVCAAASAIALLVALDRSVRRWREPGAAKTT